jgi:hypothetical protein
MAIYLTVVVSVGTGVVLLNAVTAERLVLGEIGFSEKYDFVTVEFTNVGTADVVLAEVLLNYRPHYDFRKNGFRIFAGETQAIGVPDEWKAGQRYTITLVTRTGKTFSQTGTAPERHVPLVVEATVWNLTDATISVCISNIDKREQNITGFGWAEFLPGYFTYRLSEISTNLNVCIIGPWEYGSWRMRVPAGQTGTVILDWPHHDPWVSGKTYFFHIATEAEPDVAFTSKAP